MEIVRCEKGHFYDAERSSTCPQCAMEAQNASTFVADSPLSRSGVEEIGATEPVAFGGSFASPVESVGVTTPVSPGFAPEDFIPKGGSQVEQYESTTPVSPNGVAGFNPVVGWLVCIDGPDKGQDYRIHAGYNYIGRAQSMDICIQGDTHISNQNAGVIGYDDLEHLFSFGPSGGHNTVRVNGKMVINAVELSPYDELTVGTTKLMFVPLCGERFNWDAT